MADDSASARMGDVEELSLRKVGRPGMPGGSWSMTLLMAACTSREASFRSRSMSKKSRTSVEPVLLDDEMDDSPAMAPSARSSGPATVAAMLVGLAPGRLAVTTTIGVSICGSGATGSCRHASQPASRMASASMVLPMGRRMKGRDRFISVGQSRQGRAHGQQVGEKNGFIGLGAARSARRTGR